MHVQARATVAVSVSGDAALRLCSPWRRVRLLANCASDFLRWLCVAAAIAGEARFSDGPMCRNCHIYVDNAHVNTLPPKGESEEDLTVWIKNKTEKSHAQSLIHLHTAFAEWTHVPFPPASCPSALTLCVLLCAVFVVASSRFACEIIVDASVSGMTVVIPDYPERD